VLLRREVCAGAEGIVGTCHELSEALGTQIFDQIATDPRWSIAEQQSVRGSSAIVDPTELVLAASDIDRVCTLTVPDPLVIYESPH